MKQAMIAKERSPGLGVTLFYMDIRAHGKDFDAYYERAKKEYGVRFIRSMISLIIKQKGGKDKW